MNYGPALLLVAAVATVGVLHTIVPDHWVPITLIARQRGWSKPETARAALQAGTGHVLSTLLIALVVWLAGVAFAERFGHIVDTVSSLALIAFGGWFAVSAWRDLRKHGTHGHTHSHDFPHLHRNDQGAHPSSVHNPESKRIATEEGVLELSIFETGVPPRFRLSGITADTITLQTLREGDERQDFRFVNRGTYWESVQQIPEPHQFAVSVIINHAGHARRYETQFSEHDHGDHEHGHDHTAASSHSVTAEIEEAPPAHDHRHKTTARTALLLILGSSPMVEGIPAFFAAGKYGIDLIVVMAIVFAISTIATYVLLCVYSTAGLQRLRLGAFERYGEVLSGAFIALIGLAFWIWPVL